MQVQLKPVGESDSEQLVLERILRALDELGSIPLDDLVGQLGLYRHPSAEKILQMAISDGLIDADVDNNIIRIGDLGRKVGNSIRQG